MTNGGIQIIRIVSNNYNYLTAVEYPLVYWTTIKDSTEPILLVGTPFRNGGVTELHPISNNEPYSFYLDANQNNLKDLIVKIQTNLDGYPW